MIKKKKGSALVISIVVGLIVVSLSGILLSTINNELKTRRVSEERLSAKYLAEAGIEHGLYLYSKNKEEDLKNKSPYLDSIDIGGYSGQYQLNYEGSGKFISTGITSNHTEMTISVELSEAGTIIKWEEVK